MIRTATPSSATQSMRRSGTAVVAPRDSAAESPEAGNILESTRSVPFQSSVFRDFVALVGRLFYDDACIVLLDFLAREQRAFTEPELRDRLRWREVLVQKKLANLERQLLVERCSEMERGAKSIQYWRIPQHLFIAVEWRLRALEEKLRAKVREASKQTNFQCPNPSCGIQIPILEAVAGPKAPEDDHPLCRMCGSKLTTADAEEARREAESKLRRHQDQMAGLRETLRRVHDMEIPAFSSTPLAAVANAQQAAALIAAEREASLAVAAGRTGAAAEVSSAPELAARSSPGGRVSPPVATPRATPSWFQQAGGATGSAVGPTTTLPSGAGAAVGAGAAARSTVALPSFGTTGSQVGFGLRGGPGGPAKLPATFGTLGAAGQRRAGMTGGPHLLHGLPSQFGAAVGGGGSQLSVRSSPSAIGTVTAGGGEATAGSAGGSAVGSSDLGAKSERSPLKLQFGSGTSGVGSKPFSVSLTGGRSTLSPSGSAAGTGQLSPNPLTPGSAAGKRRQPMGQSGLVPNVNKRIRF